MVFTFDWMGFCAFAVFCVFFFIPLRRPTINAHIPAVVAQHSDERFRTR